MSEKHSFILGWGIQLLLVAAVFAWHKMFGIVPDFLYYLAGIVGIVMVTWTILDIIKANRGDNTVSWTQNAGSSGYSKQEIRRIETRSNQKQTASRLVRGRTLSRHTAWMEAIRELEEEGRIRKRDNTNSPPKDS